MKSLVAMSEVETTTLSALTCEPLPKTTPDWLIRTTWPLALIWPLICERLPVQGDGGGIRLVELDLRG
jgi:hypothetical protein